jgi:HEAT repeat protein
MRFFRFEKYVKGLTSTSYDAIPALIEAIGYENTRFREPATQALLRMLPAAREQAVEAIPHLTENLRDRRAQVIQLSIIALGYFGPHAKSAVPALIEQLRRTEKTNTYEVTPDILRFQAARALGSIGPGARDAVPALKEASADPSQYVRDAARHALKQIDKGYSLKNR